MVRISARSVDIAGDATGAIIITGDGSSVVVQRAGQLVFALSPLAGPPRVPVDAGPAALLMARHELVDFTGGKDKRTEAPEWLGSDRRRAVRLVTGPGGRGKSRFALHVARDAAAAGWQVLLARHSVDGRLLAFDDPPEQTPVRDKPVGVLVVVDYADRWPEEDLRQLLIQPEASRRCVRMLLRPSGAFWSVFSRTLGQAGIEVSRRDLEPLADAKHDRESMFEAAVHAFANELGVPTDDELVVPDLSRERFGVTLAVRIAALVMVLRRRDGPSLRLEEPALNDPAALSRELLIREVDHWQKMTKRGSNPLRLSTKEMARAVLIATLTRGVPVSAARQEALDAPLDFFRRHPDDIDREWLLEAVAYLRGLSATSALVNEHSALCWCRPRGMQLPRCFHSGDAETSDADYDERSEVFLANGVAHQFIFRPPSVCEGWSTGGMCQYA